MIKKSETQNEKIAYRSMTCTKTRTITMGKTSNRKRLAIKLNDHIF